VARARGGCEDKGRWFALPLNTSLLSQATRARAASPQGISVTEDSAFKRQVRARMAQAGEKYTLARRRVIEDAAIRDAVQRSLEQEVGLSAVREVGLSAVEVYFTADWVHVTIRAARPDLAWGFHQPPREDEGIWRKLRAERLRDDLVELTGKQVRLDILQVPDPQETPG
jgi:ribosomal protein S3